MFIALGLSFGAGSTANLQQSGAVPVSMAAWLLALIPVMFAYSGWNAAAYIAEEIRDPGRNVPRALALGTAAVIAVYVLLNLLYLFVLPVGELAKVKGSVLDVIADRLLGTAAGDVMGVVSIVSLLASISAMTFAGPRVYYAMARDGLFFRSAARVDPVYRTPARAILAQGLFSTLLVLSGGAMALTTYTAFTITLFNGIAVAALFVLRRRDAGAPRPFSTFGYPWAPGLFAAVSLVIVANALWTDLLRPIWRGTPLGPSAAGLVVIALGLPLYAWFTRSRVPAGER